MKFNFMYLWFGEKNESYLDLYNMDFLAFIKSVWSRYLA